MPKELQGACGCGAVRFRIDGPVRAVVNCHCNTCRQRNGAAYSTYCVVPQADLVITTGEDSVSTYEVDGRGRKQFCLRCGSPLFNDNIRYPGMYMIYFGTLRGAEDLAPTLNVYCESKLAWVDSLAGMKSFEQGVVKRPDA